MSAAETIAKAIEKLERLRDERNYQEAYGWLAEEFVGDKGITFPGPDESLSPVTNDELFVTLHRTIDAQLAILRQAAGRYEVSLAATQRAPHGVDDEGGIFYRKPAEAEENAAGHIWRELDLAKSILGGDL